MDLKRIKVVALMNLLSRLSESLGLRHDLAGLIKNHNQLSTSDDETSTLLNQRWTVEGGYY